MLWLALTLLSAGPAQAQPQAEVAMQFNVFAPRVLRGLSYLPANDPERSQTLRFYNNYRSPNYVYRGPASLAIYDEQALAAARATAAAERMPLILPPPVAVAAVPPGLTRSFLLFFPRSKPAAGEPRYDVFVLDDGETNVPANHVVVINASRQEWLGQINGQDVTIPRGIMRPIRVVGDTVTIALTSLDPTFQSVILSDRWESDRHQRSLVLLFPPRTPTALLPEMVRLIDTLPPADGPAARP